MTVKIIHGDCRDILPTLPSDSFDCIVTSPPYWGLRDYGVDGQIGLEPTMQGYLDTMVGVCRELRRVLKPEGTFWLNVGDSYAANRGGTTPPAETLAGGKNGWTKDGERVNRGRKDGYNPSRDPAGHGLKHKDLCMIPNRLAILLQEPWYSGRIPRVEDRIWLAAMMDGEGCLFIHKRKAGSDSGAKFTKSNGETVSYMRTADSYAAGLEIANTCEAIVERCRALTGFGSITRQDKDRRQPLFRWHLRANEAKAFVEEIYPHLVAKQQQARILVGCPSSGERAAAAHAALIDLHNGKPSDVDFPAPKSLFEKGWFVRSEIVWFKANPMPESVRDRPTCAHEKMWMMAKSERYLYNADEIAEPSCAHDRPQRSRALALAKSAGLTEKHIAALKACGVSDAGKAQKTQSGFGRNADDVIRLAAEAKTALGGYTREFLIAETINARNVWTIASQPYSGAHFATMPPALAERCIKAGCPAGGHVLDPFGGAGTTGLVADRFGRNATLIELNPQYRELAASRLADDSPLFAEVM